MLVYSSLPFDVKFLAVLEKVGEFCRHTLLPPKVEMSASVMENVTVTEDGQWKPIEYEYEVEYKFSCEYSKTGRAKCRRCGELIPKGSVRIAKPIKWRGGDYGIISSWQHLQCTRVDNPKKFSSKKLVFGLSKLKPADRKAVVAELKKSGPPPHLKTIDPNDPNFLKDKSLPEVPAPSLLIADLLPYQKEGLGWLLNQEFSHYRGGILADEMGMGKTIQALSLVLASKVPGEAARLARRGKQVKPCPADTSQIQSKEKANAKSPSTKPTPKRPRRSATSTAVNYAESSSGESDSDVWEPESPSSRARSVSNTVPKAKKTTSFTVAPPAASKIPAADITRDVAPNHSGPTLIVCPSSAMLQWRDEILKFTAPGCLRVVVFYNNRDKVRARDLQAADVVLTTYPILEYDFRTCMNKAKVNCQYCGRLYLERKLKDHQKYFCGPNSKRSEKQRLRERSSGAANLSAATKRGMATLKIGTSGSQSQSAKTTRKGTKTRRRRRPTEELSSTSDSESWEPSSSDSDSGPGARSKQARTKKNRSGGSRKANSKRKPAPAAPAKTHVHALTPSGIYRSLMAKAGRPTHSRWAAAAEIHGASSNMATNPTTYILGSRVEAKWQGGDTYYPGKVFRVHRGKKYDIDYDDGDSEKRVPADLMRMLNDANDDIKLESSQTPPSTATTTANRPRRTTRKCTQCGSPSGALMFSAGKLTCLGCIDLASTATAGTQSPARKGLKLARDIDDNLPTPVVDSTQSSSDEWTPPTKARKPSTAKAKRSRRSKSSLSKEAKSTAKSTKAQSTPSKTLKNAGGIKCTRARRRRKSPPPTAAAQHGTSGHSSAEDDDLLTWAIDDQEGVDLRQSTLHRVRWTRVILDEAHKIKARTNSTAKAAYNLHSTFKWCLTGTPLQNRVGELYALIRFIKVNPFAFYFCRKPGCSCKCLYWSWHHCPDCGHTPMFHYSYFNRHVMNPIQRYGYVGEGRKAMLTLKNEVMDKIMLRRTKAERASDLKLPELEVKVVHLTMSEAEQDFYESIYKMTRAKFDTYVTKGTLLHNYAHIFELLARLRQAVNHPYLVVHGTFRGRASSIPSNSRGGGDVCGICQQDIVNVGECSISACHHTFHQHCISDHIEEQKYHMEQFNQRQKNQRSKGGKTTKVTRAARSKKNNFYTSCPVCYQPLTLTVVRGASKSSAKSATKRASLRPNEVGEQEQCVICCTNRRNALLLDCGHMFTCSECFDTMHAETTRSKWACPICRQKVRKVVTVGATGANEARCPADAAATAQSGKLGRKTILQNIKVDEFASSTKIEALAAELQRIKKSPDKGRHKSIVFSQYNRMIDLCEFRLKQLGLQTVKLMGYMPMKERRSVLHAFKSRPDVDVILMSLKAGGEGLNLQEAAQVFILDPWWNPQVEAQAIQRAHRLGQKHKVVAIKFVTSDSIEERMHELSNRKQLMFEGTVDGSAFALSQLTSDDLKFLFTGT